MFRSICGEEGVSLELLWQESFDRVKDNLSSFHHEQNANVDIIYQNCICRLLILFEPLHGSISRNTVMLIKVSSVLTCHLDDSWHN